MASPATTVARLLVAGALGLSLAGCTSSTDAPGPPPQAMVSTTQSASPSLTEPAQSTAPSARNSPEAPPPPPDADPYPPAPMHTGVYTLEEIFNQGDFVYVTVYAEMLGNASDPASHILCSRSGSGYHECKEFLLGDVFVIFEAYVPVGTHFQFGASNSATPLAGNFLVVGAANLPAGVGANEQAYYDIQFDYGAATIVGGVTVPSMFVK